MYNIVGRLEEKTTYNEEKGRRTKKEGLKRIREEKI